MMPSDVRSQSSASLPLRCLSVRRLEIVVAVLCALCLTSPLAAQGQRGSSTHADTARGLYEALAAKHDLRLVFDRNLRDQQLMVDVADLELEAALHVLDQSAGFFTTKIGEDTYMVAEDTPQKRRQYAAQVVQVLHLQNMQVKDAMTILRSQFGLKHVAAQEELQQIVLRDTAEVVQLASDLIARIDQPRGEVEVGLEVLQVSTADFERLSKQLGSGSTEAALPQRLTAAQVATVRRLTNGVAAPSLSVLDGESAYLSLTRHGRFADGDGEGTSFEVGLQLELTSRTHPAAKEATLKVEATFLDLLPRSSSEATTSGPVVSRRKMESEQRLAEGQGLLLSGFAGSHQGPGVEELLAGPAADDGQILLLLTPSIVRLPAYSKADLEAVCVGTETNVGMCP